MKNNYKINFVKLTDQEYSFLRELIFDQIDFIEFNYRIKLRFWHKYKKQFYVQFLDLLSDQEKKVFLYQKKLIIKKEHKLFAHFIKKEIINIFLESQLNKHIHFYYKNNSNKILFKLDQVLMILINKKSWQKLKKISPTTLALNTDYKSYRLKSSLSLDQKKDCLEWLFSVSDKISFLQEFASPIKNKNQAYSIKENKFANPFFEEDISSMGDLIRYEFEINNAIKKHAYNRLKYDFTFSYSAYINKKYCLLYQPIFIKNNEVIAYLSSHEKWELFYLPKNEKPEWLVLAE